MWVRNGQIRYREDILDGLEQAPGSIAGAVPRRESREVSDSDGPGWPRMSPAREPSPCANPVEVDALGIGILVTWVPAPGTRDGVLEGSDRCRSLDRAVPRRRPGCSRDD
jgi:hypothetical protein